MTGQCEVSLFYSGKINQVVIVNKNLLTVKLKFSCSPMLCLLQSVAKTGIEHSLATRMDLSDRPKIYMELSIMRTTMTKRPFPPMTTTSLLHFTFLLSASRSCRMYFASDAQLPSVLNCEDPLFTDRQDKAMPLV